MEVAVLSHQIIVRVLTALALPLFAAIAVVAIAVNVRLMDAIEDLLVTLGTAKSPR